MLQEITNRVSQLNNEAVKPYHDALDGLKAQLEDVDTSFSLDGLKNGSMTINQTLTAYKQHKDNLLKAELLEQAIDELEPMAMPAYFSFGSIQSSLSHILIMVKKKQIIEIEGRPSDERLSDHLKSELGALSQKLNQLKSEFNDSVLDKLIDRFYGELT